MPGNHNVHFKMVKAMNQSINQTASGTLTGTLLVLLMQISSTEFAKTIVMAALGAVVSFGVSFALRKLQEYFRK